jgi:hypothetical protein
MYDTGVLFLFPHIFAYPNSKYSSMDFIYGSYAFHRFFLSPKWTSRQGFIPSTSKLVVDVWTTSGRHSLRIIINNIIIDY